ncbi:hypothetical protein N7474_008669 [Penicillium riverlandense]|uniref:uncharacterized protein n=1 Tax=Penicillium riverlandense TaxID=1903569 RepID=UPI002547981C|nr:uncharacterized protein N7474_008669 [Penicillium riverlandense]KAJ5812368.1 hypothetical protein N7474_008669 [Penicillium riverlandense]
MGKTKNAKALTHEEIWDDSALVRSWDEAVEEYQLYHSIHAKGENVEDVLREAEREEADVVDEGDLAEDTLMEGGSDEPIPDVLQPAQKSDVPPADEGVPAASAAATPPASGMPMPHPALAQVQDEGLKNLMMAWYFAGYYTGLHEGQQQGKQ